MTVRGRNSTLFGLLVFVCALLLFFVPFLKIPQKVERNQSDTVLGVNSTSITYDWTTALGDGGYFTSRSATVDSTGDVLLTGKFSYTGNFDVDPTAGEMLIDGSGGLSTFFVKYSQTGQLLWARSIPDIDMSQAKITVDSEDNYHIALICLSSGGGLAGDTDMDPTLAGVDVKPCNGFMYLKIGKNGEYIRSASLPTTNVPVFASDIAVDSLNNAYIVGYYSQAVDFNPAGGDPHAMPVAPQTGFVWKINDDGSYGGTVVYPSSDATTTFIHVIAFDSSDNQYLVGRFSGPTNVTPDSGTNVLDPLGQRVNFVIKTDSSGNLLWSRIIGTRSGSSLGSSGLSTYGPAQEIRVTDDGTVYYVTAATGELAFDEGQMDFITINRYALVKFSPTGSTVWAQTLFDNSNDGYIYDMQIIPLAEDIVFAGEIDGTVDISPNGDMSVSPTGTWGYSPLVFALDNDGDYIWHYAPEITGEGGGSANGIAVNNTDLFITGEIYGTMDYAPGAEEELIVVSEDGGTFFNKFLLTNPLLETPTPTPTATDTTTPTPTITISDTPSPTPTQTPSTTPTLTPTAAPTTTITTTATPTVTVSITASTSPSVTTIPTMTDVPKLQDKDVPFMGTTPSAINTTSAPTQKNTFTETIATLVTNLAENGILIPSLIAVATAIDVTSSLGMIAFVAFRNKKSGIAGIVYDAVTKQPISRAIVRVMNEQGELLQTMVTDARGLFQLDHTNGAFTLRVTRGDYIFPSALIIAQEDGPFKQIYHGEVLRQEEGKTFVCSIPLDPIEKSSTTQMYTLFQNILGNLRENIITMMYILTFIYSSIVLFQYPTVINLLFTLVPLAIAGYNRYTQYIQSKTGKVVNTNGDIISNLQIGLFEPEFGTLLYTTYTDSEGRYSFIVENRDYIVRIMDQKYKLTGLANAQADMIIRGNSNEGTIKKLSRDIIVSE